MPTPKKSAKPTRISKLVESHIFLSHADADKDLANKLADLLSLGCDVSSKRIFCTSLEGQKIPAGSSFPDFIREKIQNPALVIALITPNYLASEFCLCELGATWAMGHDLFPIIVKPAERGKMKGVLTGIQIEKIEDSEGLDNLRDRVKEVLACEQTTGRWNAKRDTFLAGLNDVLSKLKQPGVVDRSEMEAVKSDYESAIQESSLKDEKIEVLEEMIEALKQCKDADEVAGVLRDYSNEEEEFEKLVEAVDEAFGKVPKAVVEALFQSQHSTEAGWDLFCGGNDPNVTHDEAAKSVERRFLSYQEEGWYKLNRDHPLVSKAEDALKALKAFLAAADPDFINALEDEHEVPVELSNRDFWDALFS
jgi:hypothetical protein